MTSRKQLRLEIAQLEKELLAHKIENYKHKNYLINLFYERKSVLLLILVPAFFVGWQTGKRKTIGQIGKSASNLVVLTTIAAVRKRLWRTLAQKFSL